MIRNLDHVFTCHSTPGCLSSFLKPGYNLCMHRKTDHSWDTSAHVNMLADEGKTAENIWGIKPFILESIWIHLTSTRDRKEICQVLSANVYLLFYILLFCICNIIVSWFAYYLGVGTSGSFPSNVNFNFQLESWLTISQPAK